MYSNASHYEKLSNFFFGLKDQVLQFEDFFLKGYFSDLLEEIKYFGRLVIGSSIQDFWQFSKTFNAKITFFDGIDKIIEINEAEFCEPIDVAIYKLDAKSFIIYRVSEKRDQLPGDTVKPQENIYELCEELGLEIFNTLRQDINQEKNDVASKFINSIDNTKYSWRFFNA